MKYLAILLSLLLAVLPAMAVEVEILSTDPAPIRAGDYADVTILFSKAATETTPQQIMFQIVETEYIKTISDGEVAINGLRSDDDVTRTFRVFFSENLPEGFVDIETKLVVDSITLQRDLRVFVQEDASDPEIHIGSIVTTPNELLPDTDNNELLITLQNLGDKDAQLLRGELILQDDRVKAAYAYSLIDSVSQIETGDEAELFFVVDIEEDVREAVQAELRLRYRSETDSGTSYETFETALPLVIPIQEAPFLEVVGFEQLSEFATGSTENTVRLAIKNTGVEEARDVRVRVLPDISMPFIFELTTAYVASEIEPGETAYVEFNIEVMNAQIREYPISVRLESLVGESRYSREDDFSITPAPGRDFDPTNIGVAIVGIAGLAAVVLGIRLRKR